MPKISIIISTYNDENYLSTCLDSIIYQTFSDWELIIINDNSTDKTRNILKKYKTKDKRIKVYSNKKNKGLIDNLNKGIKLAKGEFIARIDGDDAWNDAFKLERQTDFLMSNSDFVLVGTWARAVNERGDVARLIKYPVNDDELRKYFLIENCFLHSSVIIRAKALQMVGGYNKNDIYAEDYGLWLKLATIGKIYNIPSYLTDYRINPKGITHTFYHKQLITTRKLIHEYKDKYPNYLKAIIMWQLREYIPQDIKIIISNLLKGINTNSKFDSSN